MLYKHSDTSNSITQNFATKHRIWERNDVVKIIFTFGNVLYTDTMLSECISATVPTRLY